MIFRYRRLVDVHNGIGLLYVTDTRRYKVRAGMLSFQEHLDLQKKHFG